MSVTTELAISDLKDAVHAAARRARVVSRDLARLTAEVKNVALLAAADAILAARDSILAANSEDVARARRGGTGTAMIDRLALDAARINGIADGLRQVAGLPDPVGEVQRGSTRPNGLRLRQIRVPLGVVGMVYEGRPNVTVDAFGLTLKSGNAALLRGSSSAASSNEELVRVLRQALVSAGLPPDTVQLLDSQDRATVTHLIQARGLVDVVIPRGGAGLIDAVVRDAQVPTIETGVGNCHVYVHADADLAIAERIVLNSKTRRPSVCNAAETLLIDKAIADEAVPRLVGALQAAGVTVHADEQLARRVLGTDEQLARRVLGTDEQLAAAGVVPLTEEDFRTEYLSLDIAAAVVDDLDAAIHHIESYSSGHTDAIVTSNLQAAQEFTDRVDSAAVMVNASTAFTDGEQFGFGAEIGISTQKLHVRGPMGLAALTTTKWIVFGDGQIRPA